MMSKALAGPTRSRLLSLAAARHRLRRLPVHQGKSMCINMCVYIYIYICVCPSLSLYIYIYIYICLYVYMCIYIYTHM